MKRPAAYLRALLNPGGVMRIGLYSHRARGAIRKVRQLIRAHGLPPTQAGIRAARRLIADRPMTDTLHGLILSPDFYTVSECRDLMFHVQEHQLDLPAISAMLECLQLEFLGFEFEDLDILNRNRSVWPEDPDAVDLTNWHTFECEHADSFAAQYVFWARAIV